MGQTNWIPRPTFDVPRSWLLTNGEVVTEPALEETTGGRMVRVVGTDLKAYARDVNDLILKAVEAVAESKSAKVWMPLKDMGDAMIDEAGFKPGAHIPPKLYVVSPDLSAETVAWWRFKHPTLPIEALLYVKASRVSAYAGSQHAISTRLVAPQTRLQTSLTPDVLEESDPLLNQQARNYEAREFVRDNPPSWPLSVLGHERAGNERRAVELILEKVRAIDDLESIEVLDMSDEDSPAWMQLELYETNVNNTFITDLTEYLQGTPTLSEALRLYNELRDCLRGVGLVLPDKQENDFQKALLGEEGKGLPTPLGHPHGEGDTRDGDHNLTLDLTTGTFVVTCALRTSTRNEVADRWEEALAVASLTGQEDTLLAYAREYVRTGNERRARQILKERRGSTR